MIGRNCPAGSRSPILETRLDRLQTCWRSGTSLRAPLTDKRAVVRLAHLTYFAVKFIDRTDTDIFPIGWNIHLLVIKCRFRPKYAYFSDFRSGTHWRCQLEGILLPDWVNITQHAESRRLKGVDPDIHLSVRRAPRHSGRSATLVRLSLKNG